MRVNQKEKSPECLQFLIKIVKKLKFEYNIDQLLQKEHVGNMQRVSLSVIVVLLNIFTCGNAIAQIVSKPIGNGNSIIITIKQNGDTSKIEVLDSDGLRNGKYIEFGNNGKRKALYTYRKGSLDGRCVKYHTNGTKYRCYYYKADKLNGRYYEYSEEGVLLKVQSYSSGYLTGESKEYYDSGNLKSCGEYDLGTLYRIEPQRGVSDSVIRGFINNKNLTSEKIAVRVGKWKEYYDLPSNRIKKIDFYYPGYILKIKIASEAISSEAEYYSEIGEVNEKVSILYDDEGELDYILVWENGCITQSIEM